ncbi:hypothetical protein ILYODFUR_015174, partial [Ilyodon furcidens]
SSSPGETKLLASEIYEILQSAGKEEAEQAEAAAASCRRKAHFFLGSNNKRAKTVVLHIDGLDDSIIMYVAVIITDVPQHLRIVYVAPKKRVEGTGCKCPPPNSRMLRLNLNVAQQEACI